MAASGAGVLQMRSRRVRAQPRRGHPLPFQLQRHARHHRQGGRRDHGTGDHLGRHARHLGGQGHARGRARPPRRGGARSSRAMAEDNVNVDMIIQNVSEDGTTDISFTVPKDDLVRARRAVGDVVRRARRARLLGRRVDREGLARRRGHEDASRRRGQDVLDARRRRRQPRPDLDLADPHQLRDQRRAGQRRRSRAARRVRAVATTRSPPRYRPAAGGDA